MIKLSRKTLANRRARQRARVMHATTCNCGTSLPQRGLSGQFMLGSSRPARVRRAIKEAGE